MTPEPRKGRNRTGHNDDIRSTASGAQGAEFDPQRFVNKVEALVDEIPADIPRLPSGKPTSKKLLERLGGIIETLHHLYRDLDPTLHLDIYDPSHPEAAADLIAARLQQQGRHPLGTLQPFWGSGVYALYYTGDHPAYARISGGQIPIYVGKADPERPDADTARKQGRKLHVRLAEHARSITAAEKYALEHPDEVLYPIALADFQCRYLVLSSAYAGAVESSLIRHCRPVWNNETGICKGFGKHGDSATTRSNARSDWDTLYPGRAWATGGNNIPNQRTAAQIASAIIEHCRKVYQGT